mmetsp:Transcript_109717/g.171618  ORF Transcript_109717/g.171618 Transcript_109717/m.171618 type:complete len:695 (+) Transcript_109717:39-2123(+)
MPEETPQSNSGVGLIFPPPDIRGVIDKTAQFVAKCGPEFEQRVLREQNHTKFAFLLPSNPYRPYYEHRVKEFKTGVVEETKPEVPAAIQEQKAKEEEKKRKKDQLKSLTMGEAKRRKVVKAPPPDQFVVSHPYIAPMDADIIKLTAQFVARNGQKFLIGLTQRESRNPQFDFLKPTHALFGYFTSLVDAYTKCLMPSKDEVEKLKKKSTSASEILDQAMTRYYWDEQEESQRRNREEEDKAEKEQMQMIDWHEFVVVETIEFTAEDDNIPLAAPIDVSTGAPQGAPVPLDQAGTFFQEAHIEKPKEEEEPQVDMEKEEEEKKQKQKEREEKEKEEQREKEEREKEERERLEREREEAAQEEALPEEEPMEMEPEIPMPSQDSEMKVRKDYIRHKKAAAQRLMQRCPITGQLIPAEEMSSHLKVLLLDPKWKHQKDALVERARKESAFADDVEANLAGFVAKRPDLFGSVDEQIREAAEAGAEAAARDAGADAGPAHTMVPPTQASLTASSSTSSKPTPSLTTGLLGSTPGMPGSAPALMGPITGVSTINSRLPSAALPPPTPGGSTTVPYGDDDDEDDDPTAKKPNPAALLPENKWLEKYSTPIQVLVQVNLGADGVAGSVPSAVPLELSVKTTIQDMKDLLVPKVQGAAVAASSMKLKVQSSGFILKNHQTLAYYNIAPGAVIELTKKQRGGK